MDSTKFLARRAGLLYVLSGSLAPFTFLYVPSVLFVEGDALATANQVRASEGLLRAAICGELFGATVLVLAALALRELFKGVDQRASTLMAAIMLVSVPISYVNVLHHVAPLVLLKNEAIAAVLGPGQVAAQVTFFLRLHSSGVVINQILWGLWLSPIGVLVIRSGFIPRWLAYPLFLASAGYVAHSLGWLLLPTSLRWIAQNLQILGIGELPFFSFYLLIWGVRGHPVDGPAAILVLTHIAIGIAAVVPLMLRRIDAIQYAAIELASLAVLGGVAMRWRWSEASERGQP